MERCSSCGNDVVFEPKSHSLMCPSCKEIKKIDFDVFKPYKKGLNAQDETNEMVYECECEGCGHSLSFDKSSITFECPYCGKDTVIDNFKYDISGIIPFYNDRHDLERNYKNWISKLYCYEINVVDRSIDQSEFIILICNK